MKEIFASILNMSIGACFPIAVIFAIRALLRKKVPKFVFCLLWLLVGIKLVIPITFESNLSLVNGFSFSDVEEVATENVEIYDQQTIPTIPSFVESDDEIDSESSLSFDHIVSAVWLCGALLILVYGITGYAATKRRVSLFIEDEKGIRKCEGISSPFVFGVVFPKIYLPINIGESSEKYIIAHEKAHIKRLDYLTKVLAFIVLALHWFNPLVWAAFIALSRDIEYACDEKVLNRLNDEEKKQYAYVLLANSMKQKNAFSFSVPFGEIGTKSRIKNVFLNKFKSKASLVVIAFAVCLFALCFLTVKPMDVSLNKENGSEIGGDNDSIEWNIDSEKFEEYLKNSILSVFENKNNNASSGNSIDDLKNEVLQAANQEKKVVDSKTTQTYVVSASTTNTKNSYSQSKPSVMVSTPVIVWDSKNYRPTQATYKENLIDGSGYYVFPDGRVTTSASTKIPIFP